MRPPGAYGPTRCNADRYMRPRRGEIVLARGNANVLLPGDENVCAEGEVPEVISNRVLGSAAVSTDVVEWRVDRHEAELALVEIMPVDPEIVVLGESHMRREAIRKTGVPGVIGFGKRRSITTGAGANSSCRPRKEFENAG